MAFDLPTNFSNGTAISGVGSMLQYANYAVGGWFGTGITAMIFMMVFGTFALMNIGRAFASASFISMVFAVYMARIDLVNPSIPLVLMVMTIIGFFWAKGERGKY